jgi:hypothetical protein
VTSIVTGVATTLIWEFSGYGASTGVDPVIPAIAVSVASLIVVSLITPPPRREQLAPFLGEASAGTPRRSTPSLSRPPGERLVSGEPDRAARRDARPSLPRGFRWD